jgi:hypothetical protein
LTAMVPGLISTRCCVKRRNWLPQGKVPDDFGFEVLERPRGEECRRSAEFRSVTQSD